MRDEVESPRRQVQAHAVVGGEEAPQNHLNDVEVPVVRLLNTRAHDGRGEREQVQHGRHEHGRGGAVFPGGQVLLAAVLAERAEEAGSRSATRRVRDGAGDRADGGRLRSGFAHLAGGVGIGFGGGLGGADAERGPGHDGNTLRARVVARAGNAVALAVRAVGFVAGGVLFNYLFIVFVPRGIVRVVVRGVLCLILCRPIHRRHDTLRPLGPGAPPSVPKRSQAFPSVPECIGRPAGLILRVPTRRGFVAPYAQTWHNVWCMHQQKIASVRRRYLPTMSPHRSAP